MSDRMMTKGACQCQSTHCEGYNYVCNRLQANQNVILRKHVADQLSQCVSLSKIQKHPLNILNVTFRLLISRQLNILHTKSTCYRCNICSDFERIMLIWNMILDLLLIQTNRPSLITCNEY